MNKREEMELGEKKVYGDQGVVNLFRIPARFAAGG